MALVSTQPVKDLSNWYISWCVNAAVFVGLQPYHLHLSNIMKLDIL